MPVFLSVRIIRDSIRDSTEREESAEGHEIVGSNGREVLSNCGCHNPAPAPCGRNSSSEIGGARRLLLSNKNKCPGLRHRSSGTADPHISHGLQRYAIGLSPSVSAMISSRAILGSQLLGESLLADLRPNDNDDRPHPIPAGIAGCVPDQFPMVGGGNGRLASNRPSNQRGSSRKNSELVVIRPS